MIDSGLVFFYDAGSARSYVGAPSSNVYFTPTPDSSGNVTFSVNGNGTFKRLLEGNYGGYQIKPTDVVYRFDLDGTTGCWYHGNDYNIPSGYSVTFAFDYYISPNATGYPSTNYLANIENGGNGLGAAVTDATSTLGVWKRATMTPSGTSNGSGFSRFLLYPGACGGKLANSGYILYKNPQAEIRPFSTAYISTGAASTGSRSAIDSLLDMTGNYSIDLTSAGYDSAGGLVYSGAQNIYVSGSMGSQFENFTVDIWFKSNDVSSYRNPIDCNWLQYNGSYSNIGPRLEQNSSGNLGWVLGDISGNYQGFNVVSSGLDVSKYHNAVITKDGTSIKTYYNGNLVTSTTATYTHPGYFRNVQIGRGFSTSSERWFSGYIPTTKIYNRALSSNEVIINYNTNKSRFGLL